MNSHARRAAPEPTAQTKTSEVKGLRRKAANASSTVAVRNSFGVGDRLSNMTEIAATKQIAPIAHARPVSGEIAPVLISSHIAGNIVPLNATLMAPMAAKTSDSMPSGDLLVGVFMSLDEPR